ncbi:YopX family protein [uncultured Helicobacter sp.]|uniref:YopX family protein n=1 Tax=uncultured Helicobacter sp. TaxID=175537 RepID=UPI0037530842
MESIKFRVWDNVLKTYIGESYGDPLVLYDVFDETHNYNEKNIFIFFNKKTDRFFIETYIKLRDKNNREIFEGDIIKLKNDDRLYTVEYVKEFCAYFLSFTPKDEELNEKDKYLNKEEQKGYIPLWQNANECEVIGNRWEYPQEKGK